MKTILFRSLALACTLTALVAQDTKAPAQHLLRYAFEQGKTAYAVMTQHMTMVMDMAGTKMETAMDLQIFTSQTVAEVKDGKARIVTTIDRIKATAKMPGSDIDYDSDVEGSDPGPLETMTTMLGKQMEAELDARGNTGAIKLPDELKEAAGKAFDFEQLAHQQFQQLPDAPVAVGATWDTETSMPMGDMGKSQVKVKNKLLEVANGKAKIEQQMLIDLAALKLPGEMKFNLEKSVGTMTIDLAGWQVPAIGMEMVMTSKNDTMDMRMEMTMTTKAAEAPKKAKAKKQPEVKEAGK